MYYVYVIRSGKNIQNKLYIGFTNNLRRRFEEHNEGKSTYTRPFVPWDLVYYEAYSSKKDAKEREKQIKRHAKAWGQLQRRIINSINEN
jgi:putative endonuclease